MDLTDIQQIEKYRITGKYYINQSGYLIFAFEEVFTTLTGKHSLKEPGTIIFHAFDRRLNKQWSEIY